MRRAFASLLLTISLIFATVSWSGFIMTRTVFDPGRSERLAEEMLDNEDVRAVIVGRLAETIDESVPAAIPVSDAQLERAAGTVLDDPRVEALVVEQLVVAHQNALNGVDDPVTVDATVVGQAARDAAVAEEPLLDAVLPQVAPVDVTLPTTGFAWLGAVNDLVRSVTLIAGLIAIAGIALSLFITSDRAKILRRVAYWALGAAAFWIVAAFVAPWVVNFFSPDSMVLVSAAISVFFGAMVPPAVAMLVVGLLLYGLSVFLPRLGRQRAAALVQPAGQPRRQQTRGDSQMLQRRVDAAARTSPSAKHGADLRRHNPAQPAPSEWQARPQSPVVDSQGASWERSTRPSPPDPFWSDPPAQNQPDR